MSATTPQAVRDELIRHIEQVFATVRLEDGVSMTQARAIDDYRSDDEQMEARQKDTEESWIEISDEKIENYCDVMSFLDAKGFRFYVPAFMRYWLRNPESHSSATSSVLFHLNPVKDEEQGLTLDSFSLDKYTLLNAKQRQVVRAFLQWIESTQQDFEAADARLALEQYWSK